MDDCQGYEKLIPAASPLSARQASGRPRKVGILAALSSIFIVCAAVALVVRSVDLKDMSCPDVIHRACNMTLYVDLCISSLSSYPGALHANLTDVSRIAVVVSLREAQQVGDYIADVAPKAVDQREIMALDDCVQLFQDTVQQLNDSLSALPSKQHKDDVQTWLSAALTNPSTCVQGLEDASAHSLAAVRPKSEKVSELISNALAIFVHSPSTA